MAAADCYDQVLRCPCGSAVTLHWVDRCYLTADPELERVTGPAIRRRPKAPVIITKDHTDVLGARCGSVLHASEVTGKAKRAAAATACRQRS